MKKHQTGQGRGHGRSPSEFTDEVIAGRPRELGNFDGRAPEAVTDEERASSCAALRAQCLLNSTLDNVEGTEGRTRAPSDPASNRSPRVSICVPNLNMLPFLKARFDSILNQTLQTWEAIVHDGYSDDGAWEFIQAIAASDKRLCLKQGPRQGPYPAWNECINRARGEYIYIATSDDTMATDCLEKLVAALDRHPECDLAHCPLHIINESGVCVEQPKWPDVTVFDHSCMELAHRAHVRRAPYDGLLHLTGRHVFLSITQLLIRRTLFDKTGFFSSRWGPISDFNWGMKAGLVASMVHVPSTWASWRIHPGQLTVLQNFHSAARDQRIDEMIIDAIDTSRSHLPKAIMENPWVTDSKVLRKYYARLRETPSAVMRRMHQVRELVSGHPAIRTELRRVSFSQSKWPEYAPEEIRRWLDTNGFGPAITFV